MDFGVETPKIIPTWKQSGDRYAEMIAPDGDLLQLVFIDNAVYAADIWGQLSYDKKLCPLNWQIIFGNSNPLNLEIGIGNGAFLVNKGETYPDENWIGVEVFKKIFKTAVSKTLKKQLTNLRLIQFDADLILRLIPNENLHNIYVNFPDPWPKNPHKRRRLLKPSFIDLCSLKLVKGGLLHIATDHKDYAMEITKNLTQVDRLLSVFSKPYVMNMEDYFPTKYYKKFATIAGAYFFRYIKI